MATPLRRQGPHRIPMARAQEGRAYPDDPYPGLGFIGHYDGVIRGNAVLADIPQYDTGVELAQARGARVLHNTLVETARATGSFSSIDYRWHAARDAGQAGRSNNVEATPQDWLGNPVGRDFHLRPGQNGARDSGAVVEAAGPDVDGRTRDYGAPDIGANEWSPPEAGGSPGARRRLQGRLRLRARGVRRVRGRCLARRGDRFRVVGTLNPFVARQSFVVSFHCGRRVRNFAVVTRRFRR